MKLILSYFIITGIFFGICATKESDDIDKQVFLFTMGIFVGCILLPIRFIKGLYKIQEENLKLKKLLYK